MRSVRWAVVSGVVAILVLVTGWLAYRSWTRPPSIVIDRSGGFEAVNGEFGGYIAGEDGNGRPQFIVIRYVAPGASAELPKIAFEPDPADPSRRRWSVDGAPQAATWDFAVYLSTDRARWTRLDLSRERAIALYDRLRTVHGSDTMIRLIREEVLPLATAGP